MTLPAVAPRPSHGNFAGNSSGGLMVLGCRRRTRSPSTRRMSVVGITAEVICSPRVFRLLTESDRLLKTSIAAHHVQQYRLVNALTIDIGGSVLCIAIYGSGVK